MNRDELGSAGIPFHFWEVSLDRKEWPGNSEKWEEFQTLVSDPQAIYDSGMDVVVTSGDSTGRKRVASWMAQHFGDQGNNKYRINQETKRFDVHLIDGAEIIQPFKVKMMDVKGLEILYKTCDREDRPFSEEVSIPDFFFLNEVGSEWANTFSARIIMDFISARQDQSLPIVMTLSTVISGVIDKNGDRVYRDIASIVSKFEKVSLK